VFRFRTVHIDHETSYHFSQKLKDWQDEKVNIMQMSWVRNERLIAELSQQILR
jgi:hypothetical protein